MRLLLFLIILLTNCTHHTNSSTVQKVPEQQAKVIKSIIMDTVILCDFGLLEPVEINQKNISMIREDDSIFLYNKLYQKRKFILLESIGTNGIHTTNLNQSSLIYNTRHEVEAYPFVLESHSGKHYNPHTGNFSFTSYPPYAILNNKERIQVPLKRLADRSTYYLTQFNVYKFMDSKFILATINASYNYLDSEGIFLKTDKDNNLSLIPLPQGNLGVSDFIFEDYNDDGILDYAPIVGDSLVQFYSLQGNRFKLNPKFSVGLVDNKGFHIDKKNTHWFGKDGDVFELDWVK